MGRAAGTVLFLQACVGVRKYVLRTREDRGWAPWHGKLGAALWTVMALQVCLGIYRVWGENSTGFEGIAALLICAMIALWASALCLGRPRSVPLAPGLVPVPATVANAASLGCSTPGHPPEDRRSPHDGASEVVSKARSESSNITEAIPGPWSDITCPHVVPFPSPVVESDKVELESAKDDDTSKLLQ